MGYFSGRGLRGSGLEERINLTNEIYRKEGLALVQKIPTPITPVEFDSRRHTISLAYFEQKSTVDYLGLMHGIPLCFDAKETQQKGLPVANVHPHQVEYMRQFDAQGGLAFLLVHFQRDHLYYLLPFEVLNTFFDEKGIHKGAKTIPRALFEERFRIDVREDDPVLPYLKAVLVYYKVRAAQERSGNGSVREEPHAEKDH